MHPHLRPLADQLVDRLSDELGLLKEAREGVMGLYAALRAGDVTRVQAALPAADRLADRLADVGAERADAVGRLADELGLPPDASLSQLADRVPDPYQARFRLLRTELRDLTAQVTQFRAANANLIDRLRSYFHDVLSELTGPDAPVRYGPTGARLAGHAAAATVVANG